MKYLLALFPAFQRNPLGNLPIIPSTFCLLLLTACRLPPKEVVAETGESFYIRQVADQIMVYEAGKEKPVVTQNAKPNFRPYLHPILAPGSDMELTQYSPDHHQHQTGLYWGFTRVNGKGLPADTLKKWFYRPDKPEAIQNAIGRDFFHHPEAEYWRRVAATVLIDTGSTVRWQTVYELLGQNGGAIMRETQTWSLSAGDKKYLLDLEWKAEAMVDLTINAFDYGGLFCRMPWKDGIKGEAVNAARQRNERAEGQRAMWVDVGMELDSSLAWGHLAVLDHPDNDGFPQHWRVDGQLGFGPVRAKAGDWRIEKGELMVFRHRVIAYTGKLNDVEMDQQWADFAGDNGMYNTASLWGIAQEEGRLAKFLTPEEAVEAMTVQDGFEVNVFACEPMITQPMAFCWDDKGRLWVAENRDYESRGYGFSNSGDSRIAILEDTDKDGKADKKTIFLENIPFPAAIAVGFDGLFLGTPPHLLFVPDKNADDKAEEKDIQILLTGWGIRDRHETLNSFHWGPDGWLYGLEGFATSSVIRKPSDKEEIYRPGQPFPEEILKGEGVEINGGVWRYHPLRGEFEVVAHGFSNPWGIDYDAKGQLFISACVIPHLFHVIPGGIYQRQGGSHFNPFVYEDIQTIVDHRHRSAHGGARVYLSDAFPAGQRGRIFMANIHEHAVLSDILQPNGSGFKAAHGDDFLLANNAQWVGFSMEIGPEGGLYVLDWHDADICGKEVLNKETGRVFRIMPEKSLAANWPGRYSDLNSLSDWQLVELQLSTSEWHARRARLVLQKRASKNSLETASVSRLFDMLQKETNSDNRLRALWTLHVTDKIQQDRLLGLLKDQDPYIRAWAVQLLCENNNPDALVVKALYVLAKKEKSPVVRLYLAASLQRMHLEDRWPLAQALVQYKTDATDPNLPFMIWYGLEPLVPLQPEAALNIAHTCKIPSISGWITRRLVDADKLTEVVAGLGKRSAARHSMLLGMLAGLEGRTDVQEPSNWAGVYAGLQKDKNLAPVALQIAQQFGSAAASKQFLETLRNPNAEMGQRIKALQGLTAQKNPELTQVLPELVGNPGLRVEAIRAVAAYDLEPLGKLLLQQYPGFNESEKMETILTLSSRPVYGRLLAEVIQNGKIPKRDIPAYVAVQLRRVVGSGFVEIWGPIDQFSNDKEKDFSKYQRLLSPQALANADVQKGHEVYRRTCAACHKMFGEGGAVGPDLTGSNRSNIAYLLGNILDPSSEIQDDYRMVVITTRDGRTHSGNIIAENARQLTLRTVGQEAVLINLSDIQSREVTPQSLMPEGLLNTLTEQEVLDLVAFLKSVEKVI